MNTPQESQNMEAKIEIPQALKNALVAAVEKLHKERPEEPFITVDVGASLSCGGKIAFRASAYDGHQAFLAPTIEEAVAKVPIQKDTKAIRIAELKAKLAKLEAA